MTGLVLAAALAAAPCEHPGLVGLSARQQEEACALLASPRPVRTVDRAALEEVYRRPDFARARLRSTGALKAWLAQLRAWLAAYFETSGAESFANTTRFLVLTLACGVAVWATLKLLARRRAKKAPVSEARAASALELEPPSVHLDRARAVLASSPRDAIREGLLSLLSHLEQQRLARPDRVKTNRELAEELPARGASPELVAAVTELLRWYDGAFYSLEPVEPAAAARFVDDVDALGRRVSAGSAP